jgi:hypothetical protein
VSSDHRCGRQAWQDNPNAMWNWNGLYRNGAGGNADYLLV